MDKKHIITDCMATCESTEGAIVWNTPDRAGTFASIPINVGLLQVRSMLFNVFIIFKKTELLSYEPTEKRIDITFINHYLINQIPVCLSISALDKV